MADDLDSPIYQSGHDLEKKFSSWLTWCEKFSNNELPGVGEVWGLVYLLSDPRYAMTHAEWRQVGQRMNAVTADSVDLSLMLMRSILWEAWGIEVPEGLGVASALDDTIYYALVNESGQIFYYGPAYGESWDLQERVIEEPAGSIVPAPRDAIDAVPNR